MHHALVLSAVLAAASYSIHTTPPIVRLVPNTPDLLRTCNAKTVIGACTAFAGEKLRCACEADGEQWRIAATAQYVPVMYLGSWTFRAHEDEHLRDIDADLRQHLDDLTARRFGSSESCQAVATEAAERFGLVMDQFKLRSNARRR